VDADVQDGRVGAPDRFSDPSLDLGSLSREREKGALHRRVRVVGAEQRRIVLHVFGVGRLGEEGAAHGFKP
jgi:hypothetical protein